MKVLFKISMLFLYALSLNAQQSHPSLYITKAVADSIKNCSVLPELYNRKVIESKKYIESFLNKDVPVPKPVDPAGGYTHNQHKLNYKLMSTAGVLYQITGEEKYASFVKNILFKYAEKYPHWGVHPVKKSYAPGVIFWQSLNDAVWQVYTAIAYDCIYNYLSSKERSKIENGILFPHADYLSIKSPQIFNRIHNHGVWAAAGVGMTGLATENVELLNRALYGVNTKTNKAFSKADNSGIGFLVDMDELFSPDGYYTEGPYYQRYAINPFVLFANAINNYDKSLKIFEYRNEILRKAVITLLQLTDYSGKFLPINDALKGMSFRAPELINAVDIVLANYSNNQNVVNKFAPVVNTQASVNIGGSGYLAAQFAKKYSDTKFEYLSMDLRDGKFGKRGGISLLRNNKFKQLVTFKYASQGLSHGHFDRLGISIFDGDAEIVPDYGAARFVNVKQKEGGRYLPENKTWAKQSVAHNTIVINEKSHYNGNMKAAEEHSPTKLFSMYGEKINAVAAVDSNAYENIILKRSIAQIVVNNNLPPLVVDLFVVENHSNKKVKYDLVYNFNGEIIELNSNKFKAFNSLKQLGNENGYQHLWLRGEGSAKGSYLTLLNEKKLYTIRFAGDVDEASLLLTELGANDPHFNLRMQRSVIIRNSLDKNLVSFATIYEPHGFLNSDTEIHNGTESRITNVRLDKLENKLFNLAFSYDKKEYSIIISFSKELKNKEIELGGIKFQLTNNVKLIER